MNKRLNVSEIVRDSKETELPDIPKSKEIYGGDINDAVIAVQKITGYEITPEWWTKYVGNDGSTEEILERFDTAFEKFVREQITGITMDEQLALQEADEEYDKFKQQFKDDPEYDKLSREFLEALRTHLMNKYFPEEATEDMNIEEAWNHYASIGSHEYEIANQERIKDGTIKISRIGDVTLVANIKLDVDGNVVSGHDYNPEAQSMKDTEKAWEQYLAETAPEQRVLIYEGDESVYGSRDEAIAQRTDSGLAQFLAHEAGVEGRRGEPTPTEEMQALIEKGVSRDEVLALMVGRGLEGTLSNDDPNALAGSIYHQAAELNRDGFTNYTEKQKEAIIREDRVEELMQEMNKKAASLVPILNESFRSTLDSVDLFILRDGTVAMNPELVDNPQEKIFNKLHWDGDGRMSQIARLDMEVRDRFIFERIIAAAHDGKKPFVPYGGSHVVTLEPALRAYFEK